MLVSLESGAARACVDLHGGELRSWFVGGRELLWNADPVWWDQSAPILFPIVGSASGGQIRVDGSGRPMAVHGFARQHEFAVSGRDPASITVTLTSNQEIRKVYPFWFQLSVTYALAGSSLTASFSIANLDRRSIPYALGFHPAFRWPFDDVPRHEYKIRFEAEESPLVPEVTSDGLISARRRLLPIKRRILDLADELFTSDAMCFLNARSGWFSLDAGGSGSCITLEATGFPHLALWSRPGAPFVSMETWTGHSDPEGFTGDSFEKPSMRILAPGETADHCVRLSFRTAD
ncbi:aldose 1-epimerase family protein (plasmid) [Bradyrhizobium sp. CCGUVB1N3]|uniref:aldose 1-epimerase family protein n=1 Tax=Bradyrhizobium sp. CCGUVB1N3 TaxID=2949629 RepID=UPI0020B1C846|nr:aldose 1-epimerase family protein [Bradyrhizobium sp. CCGUVB1N3]MCP3478017.1 aldose 1-epimerase family protein [Bradyrhizobium sp. CCGUVB1N3]